MIIEVEDAAVPQYPCAESSCWTPCTNQLAIRFETGESFLLALCEEHANLFKETLAEEAEE